MSDVAREEIIYRVVGEVGQFAFRSEAYVKSHAPELRMASRFERRMSDVAREEIVYRVVGEGGQFGFRSKA
jgi:hypothetical protein